MPGGAFPELGYWFIVAAAITWAGMWAVGSPIISLGAGEPGVIRGQNLNLAPETTMSR